MFSCKFVIIVNEIVSVLKDLPYVSRFAPLSPIFNVCKILKIR